MSVSFPVGSTSLEDKYSKPPDTFQFSSQKMMVNPSTRQASPLSSTVGSAGSFFSSSTRLADTAPISSVSAHERHPQNSPFISQSNGGRSLVAPMHSSLSEVQSTTFIDHVEENKDMSWSQDSIQDLLDFPLMESVQNGQVESNTIALTSVDQAERTDWSYWDPMISIGDDLDQYWPDLPVSCNGNALDSKSKDIQQPTDTSVQLPQNYQNQTLPPEEYSNVPDPSSTVHATKPRMRWTQELHESFVESVAKLGGSERATPKGILTLMKVPGLTIYHVKSHLQKYRTARYKPEPAEGVSQKNSTPEDVKSEEVKTSMGITEALRLQVELQKRLHDQLETQRKLQLQIEEQGKYLQKMFEQHKTMGDKFKASSSTSGEPPDPPVSNTAPHSAKHDISETSEHPSTSSAIAAQDESSRDANGKEKAHETKACDEPDSIDEGSDSPPAKRARC